MGNSRDTPTVKWQDIGQVNVVHDGLKRPLTLTIWRTGDQININICVGIPQTMNHGALYIAVLSANDSL